jgi:ATP-binding cassette, subfamily B, bacterial HlyB/CyaB
MTSMRTGVEQVLSDLAPFSGLAAHRLAWLASQAVPRRYSLGHTLLAPGELPEEIWILLNGSLRSLGSWPDPGTPQRTLEKLEAGAIAGWISLLHHAPLEHLRCSTDVELLALPAAAALELLHAEPTVQQWCARQLPAAELLALLHDIDASDALEEWPHTRDHAQLWAGFQQQPPAGDLSESCRWFRSQPPHPAQPFSPEQGLTTAAGGWLRLIGLPDANQASSTALTKASAHALVASELISVEEPLVRLPFDPDPQSRSQQPLGLGRAAGPRDVPLAICLAIASHFRVPANRDALREQIAAFLQRQSQLNLINYGQLISSLGLRVVLSKLPARQIYRAPTPAVLLFRGQVGLLDGVDRAPSGDQARLLEPELGPVRIPVADLADADTGLVELLLLERQPGSKTNRFSWGWYGPYLKPHRRELIEVLATSAVVNTLRLVTPLGLQVLINQVSRNPDSGGALISISAVLLLASLVKAVVQGLRSLIFTNVANRVDQATKSTILDQLVRLPQSFFDSRPVGQITFYFSQLDRLREFLISQSLTTVVDFGFSLLYIAVLLALNPLLTLVTLSTLPLFLVLGLVSNPVVEKLISRSIGEAIRTYSYLNEAITGIQTIKSQNAELKTRWEFQNRYSRFIGEDFKLRVTSETIGSLATFISDLNGLLVIGFGIYLVMQNQLSLGAFIAFRIISGYITGPLVKLVSTWQQFKQASRSLQIVGDVVDRTTEQTESEATNIPMPPIEGRVELRNVAFRFAEDAPLVLHNVNLQVPAGCFVGMVGGSGSGKSTVLKLLPRFYRPEKGNVLIDGYDINKVELYSLRRQIGVVPQDSLLFDGTIKDNLLLVKPDATAEELIRAAKIACAHDFIMGMPQGYNSSVGERGAGLSGGQRQRMALARAVLQNPRMLILDEATSALDARTERQVCLNLFDAFRGRTVFFITHRLSTVRPADMIVLMDQGAVMESGSHRELMAQRGWYFALYQSQNQEGLN